MPGKNEPQAEATQKSRSFDGWSYPERAPKRRSHREERLLTARRRLQSRNKIELL